MREFLRWGAVAGLMVLWGVGAGSRLAVGAPPAKGAAKKAAVDDGPGILTAPFTADAAAERQKEWAAFSGVPVNETNSIGMKLVLIPAGKFKMGATNTDVQAMLAVDAQAAREFSTLGEQLMPNGGLRAAELLDAQPSHPVTLTSPFYLATTETTRAQFLAFVKETAFKNLGDNKGEGGKEWYEPQFPQTDEHPIVRVAWADAVAFCEWLSKKEGHKYRLPTEAEWEYACRAGKTTIWQNGNGRVGMEEIGNFADAVPEANVGNYHPKPQHDKAPGVVFLDGYLFTAPVGQFQANPFGLFDMHGNVWEWCQDRYDRTYYRSSPAKNPPGPNSGGLRIIRGGSWYIPVRGTCAINRLGWPPKRGTHDIGFRVVREIEKPAK